MGGGVVSTRPWPPEVLECLTVDDAVRLGACADGAEAFRRKYFPTATVVATSTLLEVGDHENYIMVLAGIGGFGANCGGLDGGGCGFGGGAGFCNTRGEGWGDGLRYGIGEGTGGGFGHGYSGFGYGYGYGDGFGDGDGNGVGDSDGYYVGDSDGYYGG